MNPSNVVFVANRSLNRLFLAREHILHGFLQLARRWREIFDLLLGERRGIVHFIAHDALHFLHPLLEAVVDPVVLQHDLL